jgi:chaperonin GroES
MNYPDQTNEQDEAQSPAIEAGDASTDPRALVEKVNIAEDMSDDELKELGEQCRAGFEADLLSRQEWEKCLEEWQKLALQVKEVKTWPWNNASNVKYPLISIASMQFNARAYPSLIPASSDVVKVEVVGKDPDGQKLEKAKRIGMFMTYQLLNQMEGWEEDMDRLLMMLPIVGTVFKKTYYDSVKKYNCSELVLPKNLVVDYWAKSLDTAERISEVLCHINKRVLKEKQMSGLWLDVPLGEPQLRTDPNKPNVSAVQDETTPYEFVEQHTYWDHDNDDYAEPYIVTFERNTGKVVRVCARFDDKCIHMVTDDKGKEKLAKIDAIHYYTKYGFIPNPEGGFYDIGFGLLLSPLNESVNTLINQLIDSGTLANLQGGFLGKGLKLKMGESAWKPGEWKSVQTTADDLRKQIVPLPVKDPSDVLFKLMGTLITGAKELASVAEIFTGKMPGQNTPATTTMATVEQGMKVFTAVYKRVYRSLKSEFKKLFELNSVYLDQQQYQAVVDEPIGQDDFDNTTYDVCPGADPNTATQSEKLMKAQGLMEMVQLGTLDIVEVTRRMLDAQEQPSADKLLNQQIQQTGQFQPPPDPKVQALQMKSQSEQQKAEQSMQLEQFRAMMDQHSQEVKLKMDAQAASQEMQQKQMMAQLEAAIKLHGEQARMAQGAQQHQQAMVHGEQEHQVAMKQSEETHKSQLQQQSMKTGSPTPSRRSSGKSSKGAK